MEQNTIYDETCAGIVADIEEEFDSLYEDMMDLMNVVNDNGGFKRVGGVMQ